MTPDEIKTVLDLHAKWRGGENLGKRADLCEADLSGADLTGANLREADLRGAYLYGAKITPDQRDALLAAMGVEVAE